MIFVYIFLYLVFLILLYMAIIKRLKILCNRHYENTWIKSLSRWYRIVMRRMIIIIIILFFLGSLILLTFTKNDILYKTWLYNDQAPLGDDVF